MRPHARWQLYSPERDAASTFMFGHDTQVHSRSLLSLALFCLGRIDEALAIGVQALSATDVLRHPNSTAIALGYVGGWVFGLCGAIERMMQEARRLISLSEQHRLAPFHAFGTAFLGWALCQRGNFGQGIETIQRAIDFFDSIEYRLSLSGHLVNLAEAKRCNGKLHEAKTLCARALDLLAPSCQCWLEPEVRRIDALIERDLRPGQSTHAEALLRGALAAARSLGVPVFELRCLRNLRDLLGPTRRDPDVAAQIEALSHLEGLDRRVPEAMRKRQAASAA
jgi:hypothetical protein